MALKMIKKEIRLGNENVNDDLCRTHISTKEYYILGKYRSQNLYMNLTAKFHK